MIAAIALTDFDDTLFQTRRKCPDDVVLTPLAFGADGAPLGYATPAQLTLVRWLEATTLLVAVTARSTDALARCRVGWRHAVAAHGGVVLRGDGTVDTGWSIGGAAAADLAALQTRVEADAAALAIGIRARIIAESGRPLYLVVKHARPDGDDPALHRACAAAIADLPTGWTLHVNGNNVAFLPPGLGKAAAVAWLLPQLRAAYPGVPAIGIGDSLTDAGFMSLADFAMVPARSAMKAFF